MNTTLYQKYRPKNFSEIIGQDYIKTILLNSISSEQIMGTYLFSGPRGTGKTSIAKILAKSINCQDKNSPLNDNCENCKYFETNTNYEDIYELDAASNNGVDDIRKIIDSVQYQPIKLNKKVYIIDEVHMLSKGAFNALLKTLEEINPNCIFILATTEPTKIPPTILSRCQRFDFKRIDDQTLKNHLKKILDLEKINYQDESLDIIVRLSDGCVRDSLSILQKIVLANEEITIELINQILGLTKEEVFEKLLEYIKTKNIQELLKYWNQLYTNGISVESFVVDFQYYIKTKIINDDTDNINQLLTITYKLNEIETRIYYTQNIKTLLDVFFIDVCQIQITKKENILENKKESEILTEKNNLDPKNNTIEKVIDKEQEFIQPKIAEIENEIKEDKEKIELTNDELLNVLITAQKNERIKYNQKFQEISSELQEIQKHGLAKFFLEGNIRAVNNKKMIVTIEENLVVPYIKRHEELQKHIKSIEKIYIIDNQKWEELKKIFLNHSQQKTIKNIIKNPESKEIDNNSQEVIQKLEKKLKTKINIIKE